MDLGSEEQTIPPRNAVQHSRKVIPAKEGKTTSASPISKSFHENFAPRLQPTMQTEGSATEEVDKRVRKVPAEHTPAPAMFHNHICFVGIMLLFTFMVVIHLDCRSANRQKETSGFPFAKQKESKWEYFLASILRTVVRHTAHLNDFL